MQHQQVAVEFTLHLIAPHPKPPTLVVPHHTGWHLLSLPGAGRGRRAALLWWLLRCVINTPAGSLRSAGSAGYICITLAHERQIKSANPTP
jgi:hypothetical protein